MPAISEMPIVFRVREFVAGFIDGHPLLARFKNDAAIMLHGSLTLGVCDDVADVDLWMLLPEKLTPAFDQASPTRFIDFKLDGRAGHFTIVSADEMRRRVERCDLPLIAELRPSVVFQDRDDYGERLLAQARRPMRDDVRKAFAQFHYVEFRSDHRAADNPIVRGHSIAVLQGLTLAISHALRCAMSIDGQPYPYIKWLDSAARQTPTGAAVANKIDELVDLMGQGYLRVAGPEHEHPLSNKLREIRAILIDRARAAGIDGGWLSEWWLHLDATRNAMRDLRW